MLGCSDFPWFLFLSATLFLRRDKREGDSRRKEKRFQET